MFGTRKLLAAIAATSSALGAGVALSNAPGASADAAPVGHSGPAAGSELRSVVSQANQLQSMIDQLRTQVGAEQTSQSQSLLDQAHLRDEQAQLTAEANELSSEQAQLTAERNALAAAASKLQAEQQQRAAAPPVQATTGASGATSGSRERSDD